MLLCVDIMCLSNVTNIIRIYIYIYIKSNIDQSIRLMICLPALMEWTHGDGYNNYAPRGNVEILFHVFLLIYVCR